MTNFQMIHLRLPSNLIKDLDSVVGKAGTSRNEVVTDAVSRYLSGLRMAEKIRRAYGSLEDKDVPEWAAGSANWVRSIREEEEDGGTSHELPD